MTCGKRSEKLSPRSEFFLIIALCFGYFAATSAAVLIRGLHEFQLTTGRVLRGVAVELALLSAAAWILRVRSWNFQRLGLRFPGQRSLPAFRCSLL
jgi:hypothetical protein